MDMRAGSPAAEGRTRSRRRPILAGPASSRANNDDRLSLLQHCRLTTASWKKKNQQATTATDPASRARQAIRELTSANTPPKQLGIRDPGRDEMVQFIVATKCKALGLPAIVGPPKADHS